MYEKLRKIVYEANMELQVHKLAIYRWGNVSCFDKKAGIVVIKPSGVSYEELNADKMVVLDLQGNVIESRMNPSSDTPTHLELYRSFESIGGICHTHSTYATIWAQACRRIPCFGTTHADNFYGPVPVTDMMTEDEIGGDYESNTGRVIVRRFADLDPLQIPAVLVANHGPFTWGRTAAKAVEAAVVLEQVAKMALGTILINPEQGGILQTLLDKHYLRKHGDDAYYGQRNDLG